KKFLGDEAVELLLVALEELWSSEAAVAAGDGAGVGTRRSVDQLVALQGSRRFECLFTRLASKWSCQANLAVPAHVILGGEELAAVWALELFALHSVHVLVVLVQVRLVVGAVLAQLTLELLGLVREVGVVVHLGAVLEDLLTHSTLVGRGALALAGVLLYADLVTLDVAVADLAELEVQLVTVVLQHMLAQRQPRLRHKGASGAREDAVGEQVPVERGLLGASVAAVRALVWHVHLHLVHLLHVPAEGGAASRLVLALVALHKVQALLVAAHRLVV
ncbi:hypothetical protein EGW08_004250, partial [Elysia chlorotica]